VLLPELVSQCIHAGLAGSRIQQLPDLVTVPDNDQIERVKKFLFSGDTWREVVRLDIASRSIFLPELIIRFWTDVTKFRQPRRSIVKLSLLERKGFPINIIPIILGFAGFSSGELLEKHLVVMDQIKTSVKYGSIVVFPVQFGTVQDGRCSHANNRKS